MAENSTSKSMWAMLYGLYLGVFYIFFILFLYYTDRLFNTGVIGYLGTIVFTLVLWYSLKSFRDKVDNGFLSYGKGVGIGVLITLYSTFFISSVYFIILTLDKTLLEQYVIVIEEVMANSGLPDELLEKFDEASKNALTPGTYAFSVFFKEMIGGTILTLIVSAIVMKVPENGFYEAVKDIE